jgi:hypothetical protein
MKAKELAEILFEYPDFDVEFATVVIEMGLRAFTVDVDDIGYSPKVVRLGPGDKK